MFKIWATACAASLAGIPVATAYVDRPLSHLASRGLRLAVSHYVPSSTIIAIWLLIGMSATSIGLIIARHRLRSTEGILQSLFAAFISLYVAKKLKLLIDRPGINLGVYRIENHVAMWSKGLVSGSLPSTHAAIIASAAVMLAFYFPRIRPAAICAIVAIDSLLILGGWHRVSDVIAGNFLGFSVAILLFAIRQRIGRTVDVVT